MPMTATTGISNHGDSGNARASNWTLSRRLTEAGTAAVNVRAFGATI